MIDRTQSPGMSDSTGPEIGDGHSTQRGHTLLELTERDDGTWLATQYDVDVTGTGETAALAAMDYCRRIARGVHADESGGGDP